MKPYIGITCGTFRDRDWSPPMNILRRTYIDAVASAGGAPFLIPLVDDEEVMRALYERIDGLLLSGGGDIEPSHYGEEPLPSWARPTRCATRSSCGWRTGPWPMASRSWGSAVARSC